MTTDSLAYELPKDDPRHPSRYAYNSLGCRCKGCRAANARYKREANRQRAERPIPDHVHGLNGYINYDCRCRLCKAAGSVRNAKDRVRRLRTSSDSPA